MATNPVSLRPLPDAYDDVSSATDDGGGTDLQQLAQFLQLMQHDQSGQRSPHVRRTEQVLANRALLPVETYVVGQSCRGILNRRMGQALTRSCRLFDDLIAELGPSLTEDQLKLLHIAKDDFIAGEYQDRVQAEKALTTALRALLLTAESRPDDDFRKLSPWESFVDGFTNNRSALRRRGLPPLSAWQEVTDDLGFTRKADDRIRQDEVARQRAFLTLLGASHDEDR